MSAQWTGIQNLLVVKADNLGDLIMSSPAIRAFKETFNCRITVLTSSMATGIAAFIKEIDDVITFDLPWVKSDNAALFEDIDKITALLKQKKFDAAVIFTVFSQNPLPAAMLCYMCGIPLRLAYCRENPYNLLTNWAPDKEPYTFIQHQVQRDLALASLVGAHTYYLQYLLTVPKMHWQNARLKMIDKGINPQKPWILLHAGVSEKKRRYPDKNWIEMAKMLVEIHDYQVLFTGSNAEKEMIEPLASGAGKNAFSLAGVFNLAEFTSAIEQTPLVVSVNTGTIHIAAAMNTPVLVLYARTNPQHTPWMVQHKMLEYDIEEEDKSKNEVIRFLYQTVYKSIVEMPDAGMAVSCIEALLHLKKENPPS